MESNLKPANAFILKRSNYFNTFLGIVLTQAIERCSQVGNDLISIRLIGCGNNPAFRKKVIE